MEVSNRIVIIAKGRMEQIGTPREVYEHPRNEFVARFIGVMNILEVDVRDGIGKLGDLAFRLDLPNGPARIGFRPYAVQISPDLGAHRFHGRLVRTYFLGIMLRLEVESDGGVILRCRMTKEEYAANGLSDGQRISFQIRQYRLLARGEEELPAEQNTVYDVPPSIAEGI